MVSGCEVGHGDASAVPLSEAVEKAVASTYHLHMKQDFCLKYIKQKSCPFIN